VTTYPTRLVGEHVPKGVGRYEVRSTTRRHRALVHAGDAAVVLGVLGYGNDEPPCCAPATEFLARARAWLARHDPPLGVRDPDSAGPITWIPDPDSAKAYHSGPRSYRSAFSAFTSTATTPRNSDRISWRPR
jgi:hypothetical protein